MIEHWQNILVRFVGKDVTTRNDMEKAMRNHFNDVKKARYNALRKTVVGEDSAEEEVYQDKLKYVQDQRVRTSKDLVILFQIYTLCFFYKWYIEEINMTVEVPNKKAEKKKQKLSNKKFYAYSEDELEVSNILNDEEETGQPLTRQSYNQLVSLLADAEFVPKRFLPAVSIPYSDISRIIINRFL